MKTKALVRFLNRAAHFDADLELADVFEIAVTAGELSSPTHIFNHCDPAKHPILVSRKRTGASRQAAAKHLKNSLRASYIKDTYEDFSEYLTAIVRACAENGLAPDRLIGEHKFSIEANDLLALGSWDAVIRSVSACLFRRLENEQSTIKLISSIDNKLSLKLDPAIRDAALPYLDLRHLLVHRDGVTDAIYCNKYRALGLKPDNRVSLSNAFISAAKNSIFALARHIDERVVTNNLVSNESLQP